MIRSAAGSSPFTKIAVTVPTEIYAIVERLRRRMGKSRSAVVASALEGWVRRADLAEAERRYVEGYLRTPETLEAVDEIAAVAAQATSHWQTWAPSAPAPATSHWQTWAPSAPSRASEGGAEPSWDVAPPSGARGRQRRTARTAQTAQAPQARRAPRIRRTPSASPSPRPRSGKQTKR